LFLTGQRLVFEQKEKVGKKLGLFGGKEAHQVLWESPVNSLEKVEAEHKGLLGGKDMLYLTFGAGAPHGAITLEVKGGADSTFWAKQIRRIASGNDDERAIEPEPALLEKVRNGPVECHICGAQLPQAVAGDTSVTCRYCGVVLQL
jgi:hypothetical protein